MPVCATAHLDQSIEDGTARKTSATHVFDIRVELAVGLSDANLQIGIVKIESRQAVQPVARRMDALVSRGERLVEFRG